MMSVRRTDVVHGLAVESGYHRGGGYEDRLHEQCRPGAAKGRV